MMDTTDLKTRQDRIDFILHHYENNHNRRKIEGAITGEASNPICDDWVRVYLSFDEDGRCIDASYEGEGCTISQAAASMGVDMFVGITREEIATFSKKSVLRLIGGEFTANRIICASLCVQAANAALRSCSSR